MRRSTLGLRHWFLFVPPSVQAEEASRPLVFTGDVLRATVLRPLFSHFLNKSYFCTAFRGKTFLCVSFPWGKSAYRCGRVGKRGQCPRGGCGLRLWENLSYMCTILVLRLCMLGTSLWVYGCACVCMPRCVCVCMCVMHMHVWVHEHARVCACMCS